MSGNMGKCKTPWEFVLIKLPINRGMMPINVELP